MKRILVEPSSCAGCRICELACSFRHNGVFSPSLSRVTVLKVDKYGLDLPLFCRQCDRCHPIEACPTEALICDLCDGSPACVERCPTQAISFEVTEPSTTPPDEILEELKGRFGIDE